MDTVDTWNRERRTRRRRAWLVVMTAAGLLVAILGWFSRPPPNPAPRDGAVLPGGAVVAWSPGYRVSFFGIERLHPFDIGKYDRIARHLVGEGLLSRGDFAVPAEVESAVLAAIHDPAYLAALSRPADLSRALEVDVPSFLGGQVAERRVLVPFRRAVGGTIVAARAAVDHGLGVNLGGGFHHALPHGGHGFCVYNDVAAAVWTLRSEGFTGRVLIIDTDVHQGDGNHAFFTSDPQVTTFSMHQGELFPADKVAGDHDLLVPAGTDDAAYLALLDQALPDLVATAHPDLVFHVAGSDVLVDDPLANLAMTPDGLVERDLRVMRAVGEVPLVHLLAGGYGPSAAEAQALSVAAMLRERRGTR